jgi:hypothetical protein
MLVLGLDRLFEWQTMQAGNSAGPVFKSHASTDTSGRTPGNRQGDRCGMKGSSTGNGGGARHSSCFVLSLGLSSSHGRPKRRKAHACNPDDLAAALAFALKFEGSKRWHNADGFMADIVAKRLVRHLERAGYVVMKRPPLGGHSQIGRGFEGW